MCYRGELTDLLDQWESPAWRQMLEIFDSGGVVAPRSAVLRDQLEKEIFSAWINFNKTAESMPEEERARISKRYAEWNNGLHLFRKRTKRH